MRRGNSVTIHYIMRIQLCTSRERDTGSWRVGSATTRWNFWLTPGHQWRRYQTSCMESYYRRVHRWVHFRLQHGRCAVRMEQASKYWGVRAARCRFWDCERSSPLSSAAWRRERTRSLGQMCWDRCCHIRSTSRMDCYLHRVERHFSYTGGIRPCRSRVHDGSFVNTAIFRGCPTLLCPDHWWSRTAV